jgi:hypothetical protein
MMLTTETTEFATRVAVFSKPDDVHELADVLAEELGLHPTDAMHEAHSVPCVLTPRLTSANAERITAAIEQLGLRTEPIPLDELRAFEDLRTVHHLACRVSGLEILDLLGLPAELIPWGDLEVLSVGETPAESSHHQQTSEFAVISSARHIQDVSTDVMTHTIELWIVCGSPERVYRLDASKQNFESLAEHKTNSMRINMRLLLQRIVRQAPHAHLTPAAREFLDHDKLARFTSPEQLLNVTQLHLLISHRISSTT